MSTNWPAHMPEHAAREPLLSGGRALEPGLAAAYRYAERLAEFADGRVGREPFWLGWAIREAFMAGITHATKEQAP